MIGLNNHTIHAGRISSVAALFIVVSMIVDAELCCGEVMLTRQLFDLHSIDAVVVESATGEGLDHVAEISAIDFTISYDGFTPGVQPEAYGSHLQGARLYIFTYSNLEEIFDGISTGATWSPDDASSGIINSQQSLEASSYYTDHGNPWFVAIYLETNCDCMLEHEVHFESMEITLQVTGTYDSTDNENIGFSYIKSLYR